MASFAISQLIHEQEHERHRREITLRLSARIRPSPNRRPQGFRLLAPQGTPRNPAHTARLRRLRQELTLQSLVFHCRDTKESGREELRSVHLHRDTESKLLQRFLTTVEHLQALDLYQPRLLPELYACRAAQDEACCSEWRSYWAARPLERR